LELEWVCTSAEKRSDLAAAVLASVNSHDRLICIVRRGARVYDEPDTTAK